jgi:hypothetical protein
MTHKIIQTDNYLLVVDDSKITEGDWFISIPRGTIHKCTAVFENNLIDKSWEGRDAVEITKSDCKKIIANLPLNNAPTLEGIDLLPSIEPIGFDEYQYTEEDLRKAIRMGIQKHPYAFDGKEPKYKYSEDEIIQSLQQPKYPIGVECEIEYIGFQDEGDLEVPKSFINSQGLTQWVGEYIFE